MASTKTCKGLDNSKAQPEIRRPYATPVMTRYGAVGLLTAGGSGGSHEPNSSPSGKPFMT